MRIAKGMKVNGGRPMLCQIVGQSYGIPSDAL